jgi:3-phenylpropionate/trans-cinnamate dioxygenase ferredoxin reductase subunit
MTETTTYLLIGGGVTSASAAQAIRKRDADGRVIIVGSEPHPPYDRPPLSKACLKSDGWTLVDAYTKKPEFYAEARIERLTGVRATGLDRAERVVTLENGDTIQYEKLLLATGAVPRRLEAPGGDLQGVLYLRTAENALAIRAALQQGDRAVLVGGGYIGLEVASACVHRGLDTTIIERDEFPWASFASPALGGFLRTAFEARGVRFVRDEVASFTGDGRLRAAQTKGGTTLDADFCVVGVGAALNVQLAMDAGLEADRQGVTVDATLRTADPHIWAAGDIANFEDTVMGKRWHVEHFQNAKWQGPLAGGNMVGACGEAGEQKPFERVPYFFSEILDLHMCLRGEPNAGTKSKVLGDLDGGEFVELYYDDANHLRMGVIVSRNEDKANAGADALQTPVREKADVNGLEAGMFGL